MDIEKYLAEVVDPELSKLMNGSGIYDVFDDWKRVDAETAIWSQKMRELEREALNELPPIYVTIPLSTYT